MIRFLRIKNLAVIEKLELEFEPGLTVLTGETGAGKSIVVGALGLLVGERASPGLVRTGESSASVEAIFEKSDGVDVLVRREIGAQGRSRAYIDDSLATTGALRMLGRELLDLHGQHVHQRLLEPGSHLDLLDQFGDTTEERDVVGGLFAKLQAARAKLQEAKERGRNAGDRLDALRFQLAEIKASELKVGEYEGLQSKKQRLSNADEIHRLTTETHTALYEGEGAVRESLATVWRKLEALAGLDQSFAEVLEYKDAVTSHLEELTYVLRGRIDDRDTTAEGLQQVEDRLAALEELARKYGQGSIELVLEHENELQTELLALETASNRTAELAKALTAAETAYGRSARRLSKGRRTAAPQLTRRLELMLGEVAMERTRCEFRFKEGKDEQSGNERGLDEGELYLSANEGEGPRPLARIASGGELSRLMLTLKTVASPDSPGRTLVFDEVDAGIGGRVADIVGRRLQGLGRRFQVLCVTHLPQIAVYGAVQVEVTKAVLEGRTSTTAERLLGSGRVSAIARMMAGAKTTAQGRRSARELLSAANINGEDKTNGGTRG